MPNIDINIPGSPAGKLGNAIKTLVDEVYDVVVSRRDGITVSEIGKKLNITLLGWEKHGVERDDLTWVILFYLSKDKADLISIDGKGKKGGLRVCARKI